MKEYFTQGFVKAASDAGLSDIQTETLWKVAIGTVEGEELFRSLPEAESQTPELTLEDVELLSALVGNLPQQ